MADELTPETIAEAAANPQSASVDGQTVTAHSIPDQIAAHKYAQANQALSGNSSQGGPKTGWGAVGMARARPTGAV